MADNVIRHDIIQLDFEADFKELTKIKDEIDDLKKSLSGGLGDEELDDLKNSAKDVVKPLENVKKTAEDVADKVTDIGKKAAPAADKGLRKVVGVSFDSLKNAVTKTTSKLTELGKNAASTAFNGLKKVVKVSFSALKTAIQKTASKLTELGKKAAVTAFNGLKKVAGISFKALTVGIGAAATAVGALVTKSVQAYADFEQLKGGVETLFGTGGLGIEDYAKSVGKSVEDVKGKYDSLKDAESKVFANANNAYKTAGLSANDYMDTVTSFSASLISSLGGDTKKAAEIADKAIIDMSDNSAKMGTDMESIIQTYQSLARGNYQMLDNLKLGFGGTKEELKRLLKEAGAKVGKTFSISSFSDIIEAIHIIQDNMGITGTTAKEASTTISGSIASMKAAWSNLLPALIQGGDSFDQCVKNLIDSIVGVEDESGKLVGGVINNLKPALVSALSGVGKLIEELAPIIEAELPGLIDELLPPLIKAATSLVKGLIKALPSIASAIAKEIPDIAKGILSAIDETFGESFPKVREFVDYLKGNTEKVKKFFENNADAIKTFGGGILGLVGAFLALGKIKSIASIFGGLFGKKSGGESGGIFGVFTELAKTKTTTVLKGMANLAIMLGGFTILAAAFAAVAPHIAQLSDFKSIIKVVGTMAILGVLGLALAKFGGIVGVIPVSTVAKGLANMAIMLAGIGALTVALAWVASKTKDLINIGDILKISAMMLVVGGLGAILSVFAGIVGAIPIPVVLTGLANMALVLAGVSALILAFGALNKIEGFNEFISYGGELLANIFNVIGKCVGSIIGGIGEGVTNSLPTIGNNLSEFAKSIEPMFESFAKADMTGIGSFLESFGKFVLFMAGEKVLSFITGKTDYAELGRQLSSFGESASGFFNTVATYPKEGFSNATALFDCLAGLKSLPKEGGIVGWFTGEVNYTNIAKGLGQLSSEKVTGFFTAVSGLKKEGFDNATALFDCLAGLKSLPKDGGVVGWFCGDVNYQNIANGLKQLSSEGVKKFFAMTGDLKPAAFENTKLLFESLASIGDLPSEGGWWQKLKGDKTTALGKIAGEIESFSSKAETFFKQVNELKLSNLNGLWDSLSKSEEVTANVSKVIDDKISEIVKKISELPGKMGEGLKKGGRSLSDALVEVWTDAVKASVKPVNKVLEAANWILKEFGSDKKVISWTPYAKGTGGHKGGNALVNDGRGAELVQMPNGRMFIPNGRNVFLPNAPKGMSVLPAEQTARLMGRKSPSYHYANGIGNIDLWDYIDNASGLANKISNSVSYDGMSGYVLNVGKGMVSTFTGAMSGWIEKLFDEAGAKSLADYVASAGVKQWRTTVIRALKMEKQYSAANVERTLFQMQTESGGNPKAINLWDSNAKKGIPSKGLMQVIDPTFNAYARSGFDKNIYDPLSNILASVRYATSRYGSLSKAYRGVGYSNGVGEVRLPTQSSSVRMTYTPESDASIHNSVYTEHNTYAPSFTLNIEGTTDDRALARKVKRWVSEAMNEAFEAMERKTVRLQEV